MAPRAANDLAKLEALGAKRLAELLIELGEGDAGIKRRLRLELRAEAGPEALAADIGKRLATLRQARSYVDWQKRAAFLKDLDQQRQLITQKLGHGRPDLALALLWRFMELAGPVMERVDDSSGRVGDVFRQACRDLGEVAVKAKPDPARLADQVLKAILDNGYGEFDRLVEAVLPALDEAGIALLGERLTAALAARPKSKERFDHKAAALQHALQGVADAQGDVDAFIRHEINPAMPKAAAEIATRLLAAGRPGEALAALEKGKPRQPSTRRLDDEELLVPEHGGIREWDQAHVEALLALGRRQEAQAFRLEQFESRLDAGSLRAYLKALPDFDDFKAERGALDHALAFPHFALALHFLANWPEPRVAARLVAERHAEIDGNLYYLLDPSAQALEDKEPLAAALLRRAMIEDTLEGAKSSRYKHAARHLQECRALEPRIKDHGRFETHDAFLTRLREQHGRKSGFWGLVGS